MVPAVEKAMQLFETLAGAPRGLTLHELTQEMDRTTGEIYRIVMYLIEAGYLEKHPSTDRVSFSSRLYHLASSHAASGSLSRSAAPYLERVAFRTEQSCHLGVLAQDAILILASEVSPRHAGYSVRAGATIPVGDTSSGAVILAYASEMVRERVITGMPSGTRRKMIERIEKIMQLGFEERDSTLVFGVHNISAPVFDFRGILAAMTIGFIGQINQRVSVQEARDELIDAAHKLSMRLGHQAPETPPF